MGKDKLEKKRIKTELKQRRAELKQRKAELKSEKKRLSAGFDAVIRPGEGESAELVLKGLTKEQLARILPQLDKDVRIAVAQEQSAFRASMMKFVREGLFQTLVKLIAGLIVGLLLFQFGLR
jgi:hypothetical protein